MMKTRSHNLQVMKDQLETLQSLYNLAPSSVPDKLECVLSSSVWDNLKGRNVGQVFAIYSAILYKDTQPVILRLQKSMLIVRFGLLLLNLKKIQMEC